MDFTVAASIANVAAIAKSFWNITRALWDRRDMLRLGDISNRQRAACITLAEKHEQVKQTFDDLRKADPQSQVLKDPNESRSWLGTPEDFEEQSRKQASDEAQQLFFSYRRDLNEAMSTFGWAKATRGKLHATINPAEADNYTKHRAILNEIGASGWWRNTVGKCEALKTSRERDTII